MDATPGFGLLVIGSGPAGVHAAVAYRDAGAPGPVALVTTDTDPPYQRPPLSKEVLAGDTDPRVVPILEDEPEPVGVRRWTGTTVDALDLRDRRVRTTAGEELRYERLVVATGSDPLELPGVEPGARVFPLRHLEHGRALVRAAATAGRAVVVGSGFIGCEAAASLARRGVRTTLVTPEPLPQAARLGDQVGEHLATWLRDLGVELRTGVEVSGVEAPARVVLDDGERLVADLVVAAVGVTQARPFLRESGLSTSDDGRLVVDDGLRTTDVHVWAAGDVAAAHHAVAGRPLRVEHWGDAVTMGGLAGRNAAAAAGHGRPGSWSDPPGFWSVVGDHTLKYAAWGDGHREVRVVEHGDGAFTAWYGGEHGEVVGVLTHDRDEDYERAPGLLARRVPLAEAAG